MKLDKLKKYLTLFFLAAFFFILIAGLTRHFEAGDSSVESEESLVVGSKTLRIERVTESAEQSIGLSKYAAISSDFGMLFEFPESGSHGFWMKDMRFAIDIIWIDTDGRIVHIEHSVSPETYPTVFGAETDARYVLEAVAGFAKQENLEVGDRLEITG